MGIRFWTTLYNMRKQLWSRTSAMDFVYGIYSGNIYVFFADLYNLVADLFTC